MVGIAITFGLNDCIGKRSEQRNLRRHLDMVVMELNDNLKIANAQFAFYERTGNLAKYLISTGDQKNLLADSLAKYYDVIGDFRYTIYKTSAFEDA